MTTAPQGPSLSTEDIDPELITLDTWPVDRIATTVLAGQTAAAAVAAGASCAIAAAAAAAIDRLRRGNGRIVYAGAGTSGRLAVQDGVELLPTYGWPADRLVPLLAGGSAAFTRSVEGAEDDAPGARASLEEARIGPQDVLIAVAASGRTPFAVAAAETARAAGALTVGLANVVDTPLLQAVAHPIALPTGREVVAGSTRMAAGTAQKIALTTLSTTIMVGLGRTYGPLMVYLSASNSKLDRRRLGIVSAVAGVDPDRAAAALAQTGGSVAAACLVARGIDPQRAVQAVAEHTGPFRDLLIHDNAADG